MSAKQPARHTCIIETGDLRMAECIIIRRGVLINQRSLQKVILSIKAPRGTM